MIQFGSVLAVMWLYRAKILGAFLGLASDPAARRFALMLIIASIPAGVAGVLLSDWVKGRLYQSPAVIASAFIIGGVAILMIERFRPKPVVFEADKTPVPRAFAVGVCQMLALVPGVSRSGATIAMGLFLGLKRDAAARFTFLLAIPAMLAAAGKEALELRHMTLAPGTGQLFALGILVSAVVGYVTIKYFLRFLAGHRLDVFAYYRFALAAATFVFLLWK